MSKKCQTCKKDLPRETHTTCEYSNEVMSLNGMYYWNECQYKNQYEEKKC